MKATVTITLKKGVLDPQGKAIERALAGLDFSGVEGARQGKIIELTLAETDETTARKTVEDMCQKLLSNPVMEDYTITIQA